MPPTTAQQRLLKDLRALHTCYQIRATRLRAIESQMTKHPDQVDWAAAAKAIRHALNGLTDLRALTDPGLTSKRAG